MEFVNESHQRIRLTGSGLPNEDVTLLPNNKTYINLDEISGADLKPSDPYSGGTIMVENVDSQMDPFNIRISDKTVCYTSKDKTSGGAIYDLSYKNVSLLCHDYGLITFGKNHHDPTSSSNPFIKWSEKIIRQRNEDDVHGQQNPKPNDFNLSAGSKIKFISMVLINKGRDDSLNSSINKDIYNKINDNESYTHINSSIVNNLSKYTINYSKDKIEFKPSPPVTIKFSYYFGVPDTNYINSYFDEGKGSLIYKYLGQKICTFTNKKDTNGNIDTYDFYQVPNAPVACSWNKFKQKIAFYCIKSQAGSPACTWLSQDNQGINDRSSMVYR